CYNRALLGMKSGEGVDSIIKYLIKACDDNLADACKDLSLACDRGNKDACKKMKKM
ncbi:MAG: hypothetical protein HQK52_23280, partial [Oligoflexia bacterium]|nr:hypothetical protein [Oligoflexia bacterium]